MGRAFIGAKLLSLNDLDPGMWVWNDTKAAYQQVRCILFSDGCYHWADGKNNNIENDILYRFFSLIFIF